MPVNRSNGGLAKFSVDGLYRYALARNLGMYGDGRVTFVMLNPSTATELEDDPTIRRCIGYATQWGYGWMYVANLSPLRATDRAELKRAGPEPASVCWENIKHIRKTALNSNLVVCAWGIDGVLEGRDRFVNGVLARAGVKTMCFGLTAAGDPLHPLYLAKNRALIPYRTGG